MRKQSCARATLLLTVVLGTLGMTMCESQDVAISLPPRLSVDFMLCDVNGALLIGDKQGGFLPEDPKLFTLDAVAIIIYPDNKSPSQVLIGPGFTTSVSRTREDVIYAVRVEWFPDRPERGHLMRSQDFGEGWEEIETAPADIIGAAFETTRSGYAWSSKVIYRTDDAGITWASTDMPGWLGRGDPQPALGEGGDLWLALGHGSAWTAESNVIARVTPGLHLHRVLSSVPFRIWGIEMTDDAPWFLADEPSTGRAEVLSLTEQHGTYRLATISQLPPSLPEYFAVRGEAIIAGLSDMSGMAPRDFLTVSENAGESWQSITLPEHLITTYCAVNARQIWMVGSSGKVYAPR